MKKDEIKELIDTAYEYGKKLLAQWHDYKMQQIRLQNAREEQLEEKKYHWMLEIKKYGKKNHS